MGSDWTPATLGEMADLKNGKGLKNSFYKDSGKYPVWGANGQIAHTDALLNEQSVIVIGRVGAYCGSIHAVFEPNWVTDNAIVATPKEGNDFRFLFYLLKYLRPERTSIGSAQPLVTQMGLKTLKHLKPPLAEQRAIAHILGSLDDKIELNRRMNQTLEGMPRAIFKSWFVDFDPVRAKAEGRPTGLPDDIAALFPDGFEDSELGEIPKGWKVGVVGDIGNQSRNGIKPEEIDSSEHYIALEHMPKRSISLWNWTSSENITSGKFRFKKGNILFGKLRPYFHKVGVPALNGVCSTDIVVVAPNQEQFYGVLLGHLSSDKFVAYTNAASTGTKMPRTNWNDMSRYPIALPNLEVSSLFTQQIKHIVNQLHASIHESHTLASLRDTLLPKLISGELRVPDAEKFVEEAGV